MSLYLDTHGLSSVAIAVCDRCHFKKPYSTLVADMQSPGLRVCPDCADRLDPWRLPPRRPETITLQYPRPDESIETGATSSEYSASVAVAGVAVAGIAVSGVSYG